MNRIKRLVLVGHDNPGSARLLELIATRHPDCEYLLVKGEGLYYRKSFLASVWKMLKEASWLFVAVRFVELLKHKFKGPSLEAMAARFGMRVIATSDINADDVHAVLKDFKPDLLVSLFTMQIYKKRVIELPTFGAITSHPSILPAYRGLEVFFWVLANDEKETGVSVFFLTEKIDDGRVIWQRRLPITPATTVTSLYEEITEVGGEGLAEAIQAIDEGATADFPKVGKGSYYGMPDRASVRRFRRLGRRFS